MEFIMATHNPHKLDELRRILEPLGVLVATADLPEVDETGTTFEKNAFLKAESACKATGKPSLADDSGLEVDALGGRPGVYSARYAGEGATDAQRCEKLLQELSSIPSQNRTARFVSVICCVYPDGRTLYARGECEGSIAFAARGNDGFGYDPVFLVGEKTYAELAPVEKDAVSHRGRALRALREELLKERACAVVSFGNNCDRIEIPAFLAQNLEQYKQPFLSWLYDSRSQHSYRTVVNGFPCMRYRAEAFVEWLNRFVLRDTKQTACVLEQGIPVEMQKEDLSEISF